MDLYENSVHPAGETQELVKSEENSPLEVDTFDGKLHVEWDPEASVTPLGQLSFFIQYLKLGHRLMPWVKDCPLKYASNNAPEKIDILGSLLLSVLSGHTRYSHITTLKSDNVNAKLLGMEKIVSDDSARRALKRIDEPAGIDWLQTHLKSCYEPLLMTPWILDTDVTVKPLYGSQEGAVVGYNAKKPGRPSHTYHTYMIANLRLVLDVEVQAGNESQSSHSLPGLVGLLDQLPSDCHPQFIRGDCDWGNNRVMDELENKGYHYLFKLKKSKKVKNLISKVHYDGDWHFFKDGWEVCDESIQLQGWQSSRRVVIIRRRIKSDAILTLEYEQNQQRQFAFIDGPESVKAHEYAVLVTNLDYDVVRIVQHYRDRADCENYFDEIKNQWGWGGFTTHDIKTSRFMARIIALIYNWWTLFVRLINPNAHLEAITSRPLLLSSVGRLTQSGRQKKMTITSQHGKADKVEKAYSLLSLFFSKLKAIAPQLTPHKCWELILTKAMAAFNLKRPSKCENLRLEPT